MGGYGSGKRGWKGKTDASRTLNVSLLAKEGCLQPGFRGGWQWMREGEVVASIVMWMEPGSLVLEYSIRHQGQDWQKVKQPVPILWVPCHFGGQRAYFRCPGVVNGRACGQRVVKLYGAGRYFLCRHCYNLSYPTQSMQRPDRLLHRANKRRVALGGHAGTAYGVDRPKGMWHKTFDRYLEEIFWAENQADLAFMRRFAGRLSAEELDMYFSG